MSRWAHTHARQFKVRTYVPDISNSNVNTFGSIVRYCQKLPRIAGQILLISFKWGYFQLCPWLFNTCLLLCWVSHHYNRRKDLWVVLLLENKQTVSLKVGKNIFFSELCWKTVTFSPSFGPSSKHTHAGFRMHSKLLGPNHCKYLKVTTMPE